MRRVLIAALGTAAALMATAASAVPTLTNTSGTPLTQQIYGIAGTGTTVYGSSPNNDGIANVAFTGDTNIAVGSGFAQINDATPNTPDWYTLVINPYQNFTDFKYSTQLTGAGTISVYYLLSGTGLDANNFANYIFLTSYSADNNNFNKLLSGATFDGLAIRSTAPIAFFEVKQMSFNAVAAVPEPATWAMMLLGLGGIGMTIRRKQRRSGALLQVA